MCSFRNLNLQNILVCVGVSILLLALPNAKGNSAVIHTDRWSGRWLNRKKRHKLAEPRKNDTIPMVGTLAEPKKNDTIPMVGILAEPKKNDRIPFEI